ncbi:MAG: SufS family cysteine desulfurase [Actinomycetaceae bacterium]|nr:SufS family cysteine desulfurase [Actinomycetaceae bacterium]
MADHGSDYSVAPRTDFPVLLRPGRGGAALVYLDSAATSQDPMPVMSKLLDFQKFHYGAVGRSSHLLAEESTMAFEEARSKVARFVGVDTDEIVFTSGATQSTNLLAYAIGNASAGRGGVPAQRFRIGPGDNIVITRAEHHANLIPWQELCLRTGAELRWLDLDGEGRIDLATLNVINEHTKLVAFTHVSNVSGAITPVAQIVEAAHRVGALTYLDACQSVPHLVVNLHDLDVDFAGWSAHKMEGPTGVGALYGRKELLDALPPYQFGGEMIELVTMEKTTYAEPPARFEAGTQPVLQAIGFGYAVDYLSELGMNKVEAWEKHLTTRLLKGMTDIPGIRVLGPAQNIERTGAVAFDVAGIHPHDVGQYLDAHGIAIRTGHHCAQPIHYHFGVHVSSRVSLAPYNTENDIDAFLNALSDVRSYFGVKD